MWLKVEVLQRDKNLFRISSEHKSVLFKSTDFGGNSSLSTKICNDKELSWLILSQMWAPIAKSIYLDRVWLSDLDAQMEGFPFPVIIKPVSEAHGNGVMMHIMNLEELTEKLQKSFVLYDHMIIQQEISGNEARFLIVGGNVVLAINRIPPSVIGDGKMSISELIARENTQNPLRGSGYTKPLSHIPTDDECQSYIQKQGYTLDSILDDGTKLTLRGNSNLGTGGTIHDITSEIHESLRVLCREISLKLELEICGIDIISRDFSRPLSEATGVILEINPTPGIWGHEELTGVNSAKCILEHVFKI